MKKWTPLKPPSKVELDELASKMNDRKVQVKGEMYYGTIRAAILNPFDHPYIYKAFEVEFDGTWERKWIKAVDVIRYLPRPQA